MNRNAKEESQLRGTGVEGAEPLAHVEGVISEVEIEVKVSACRTAPVILVGEPQDFRKQVAEVINGIIDALNTTAPNLLRLDFCAPWVRAQGARPKEYSSYFEVAQRRGRARAV